MSDFPTSIYDYRSYDDPFRADPEPGPNVRAPSAAWGWAAAAAGLLVVGLVVAVGFVNGPARLHANRTPNDVNLSAVTYLHPPARLPPPSNTPAPAMPTPSALPSKTFAAPGARRE